MNKKFTFFIGSLSTLVGLVYLTGYGYIFKALRINLRKGPLSPSTDDAEKFPFRYVDNGSAVPLDKDSRYNSDVLSDLLIKELSRSKTSSLIIVKDNKLLHEQYWKGHSFNSATNSFSMAKGILSILVGCAIDDGYLQSEDQLVSSFLPLYRERSYGKFLTLRHLMTMQAGLDWKEEYHHPFAPNSKQYFVKDLVEQTLEVDIKEMPGKRYEYQSVSSQLLGICLRAATGKDLATYLSEKIWKPLEMEFPAKWSTDEKGIEKTFCCLHATPRDYAKIGQMLLQNGIWNGDRIVSESYCNRMLSSTNVNDAFCYAIWANDGYSVKHRFFYGFLGQFIIMIPERNMVIVKTGLSDHLEVDEKLRPREVKLLIEQLIHL